MGVSLKATAVKITNSTLCGNKQRVSQTSHSFRESHIYSVTWGGRGRWAERGKSKIFKCVCVCVCCAWAGVGVQLFSTAYIAEPPVTLDGKMSSVNSEYVQHEANRD